MAAFGPVEILAEDSPARSGATCARSAVSGWRGARAPGLAPFRAAGARPRIAAAVTPAAQMFYDWAGGLIWLAMPFAAEPGAAAIREAVAAIGGHATLIRADTAVRAAVDVFQPENAAVRALSQRVKESFDPKGLLNPGRLWAGV